MTELFHHSKPLSFRIKLGNEVDDSRRPLHPPDALQDCNPYRMPAGNEMDRLVHQRLFGDPDLGEGTPAYSVDKRAADKVRARLKTVYGFPVAVGETRVRARPYFARFDTGPSTSTEVLAETYPLAICRLALLVSEARGKAV